MKLPRNASAVTEASLRALISSPSFGRLAIQVLRWLQKQRYGFVMQEYVAWQMQTCARFGLDRTLSTT